MNSSLRVYAVYDRIASTFSEPLVFPSEALAIRHFNYSMEQNPLVSDDCMLYFLGYYNYDKGIFVSETDPCFVMAYEKRVSPRSTSGQQNDE